MSAHHDPARFCAPILAVLAAAVLQAVLCAVSFLALVYVFAVTDLSVRLLPIGDNRDEPDPRGPGGGRRLRIRRCLR